MKESKILKRKMAEIVTNLHDDKGNVLFDLVFMKKVIEENSGYDELGKQKYIDKFAWIIHDKDTKFVIDEESGDEVEIPVNPHVHLQLHFPYAVPFNRIAKDFNISINFISTINSNNFKDALLYLIHSNKSAQDKHQYSWDEVISNFDVEKEANKQNSKSHLTEILNQILNGDIKAYNKHEKIPSDILLDFHNKIETAFKLRSERLMAVQHNRNMLVIYIYGASSTGKTTLAKRIAENAGLNYYISSAGINAFDDYKSQECLILEDFRSEDMTFQKLLKATDNHTNSGASARYFNRFLECTLFIITTTKGIDDLYADPFNENKEDIVQLKRRCTTMIHMAQDEIQVYEWNMKRKRYIFQYSYPNDTESYIENMEEAKKEKQDVNALLSFLKPESSKPTKAEIQNLIDTSINEIERNAIKEAYADILTPVIATSDSNKPNSSDDELTADQKLGIEDA